LSGGKIRRYPVNVKSLSFAFLCGTLRSISISA
jgi:hypothetical protein